MGVAEHFTDHVAYVQCFSDLSFTFRRTEGVGRVKALSRASHRKSAE